MVKAKRGTHLNCLFCRAVSERRDVLLATPKKDKCYSFYVNYGRKLRKETQKIESCPTPKTRASILLDCDSCPDETISSASFVNGDESNDSIGNQKMEALHLCIDKHSKMVSTNDKAVLETIFNPLLPSANFDESCNPDESNNESCNVDENVKQLELKGVALAENGDFDEAIQCFETVIDLCPQYASAYNNLSQTLRLKGDIDGAMRNLNVCVELSGKQSKTRRQALCQRALINRLKGDEELCLRDLKEAANIGSEFAKQQLVLLNPYSALCNQMLTQMFSELRNDKGNQ